MKDKQDIAEMLSEGRTLGRIAKKESDKRRQSEKTQLLREALEDCAKDNDPPTRKNVHMRIKNYEGRQVSTDMVRNWTNPKKSKWTEIIIDPMHKEEGFLIDTKIGGCFL